MDVYKQFSVFHFMVYLFPGLFAFFGLISILFLTPIKDIIIHTSINVYSSVGLMITIFIFSYMIGIFFSGISDEIADRFEKISKYKDPRYHLPDDILLSQNIFKAFNQLMKTEKSDKNIWSKNHFCICRSYIYEKMPVIASKLERDHNLYLLRRNLISPLLIFMVAGIAWGYKYILSLHEIKGFLLIIITLILAGFLIQQTYWRMHSSLKFECREVFVGFILDYKLNGFNKQEPTVKK